MGEGERGLPEPQEGAWGCSGAAGAPVTCIPASRADCTASSPLTRCSGDGHGENGGPRE